MRPATNHPDGDASRLRPAENRPYARPRSEVTYRARRVRPPGNAPGAHAVRPYSFMPETVAAAERALPHNLEAERSVLGAVLIHNEAFNFAVEIVAPGDFFRDAHRRIFEKMIVLGERSEAIDLVTLKEALAQAGELEQVGGPAYIASLVDGVPRSTNVEYYARIVKEKSTLRSLIHASTQIAQRAWEAEDDPNIILDDAERTIFSIAEDRARVGFVSMRQIVDESLPKIEQLFEHKKLITGVPTPYDDLNAMTRGLQPSDLVIVAARPSMGKTSLVLNMAEYAALEHGHTVGFFSLEMSKEQLFIRLLTSVARIDAHRLQTGTIGQRDYDRLSQAISRLSEAPIYIDDTPGMGVLEMRAKARRLAAEHGLQLLIVDYLQLMTGRGRFENRTLELAAISRGLKGLAKELSVPVLALSQLSRAPEARSDHRPLLSDLRESGALEQDADVVLMIFRPEMYPDCKEEEKGTAELIIAKQRNGPTGVVNLAFLREHTRFESLSRREH
jgi:replicative DNA helicase